MCFTLIGARYFPMDRRRHTRRLEQAYLATKYTYRPICPLHQLLSLSSMALLEYTYLRGSRAFHDSTLPTLPVQFFVKYDIGSFSGTGIIWNLSLSGYRLSGDVPIRPGEILSSNVILPNEQRIKIPEGIVRWSWGGVWNRDGRGF